MKLLKEFRVALVPGPAFGACGEGFVRISYATGMDRLETAMKRIGAMLGRSC
jgi:aminotransferase